MDGRANTWIGPAPAQIPGHGLINSVIRGGGGVQQKCQGCHDLSGLAISALGHLMIVPRLLQDPEQETVFVVSAGVFSGGAFNGCNI